MTVITTGVTDGPLVARQEIRIMLQDQDLFTLYILGLERFQQVEESKPLSWFQIAGIHGRPYVEYDPAPGSNAKWAGTWPGYCTHSSVLFPIWHRPYLALYEQALAKHVTDIANEYTGDAKQRYVDAAQRFRIPYWDWALYDLPGVITTQQKITLNAPKEVRTLDNPLYQYKFRQTGVSEFGIAVKRPNGEDEGKYEAWPSTLRFPTNNSPHATSQGDSINAALKKETGNIRDSIHKLLLSVKDYLVFSSNKYPGTKISEFQSIEQIHDGIHLLVGHGGHLSNSDFAAFDPLFAIHHCNVGNVIGAGNSTRLNTAQVDRIFALWQALHPGSYIDKISPSQLSVVGTFTAKANTPEDKDTDLTPFRDPNGGYWKPAGVRDTRKFKYTYPELAKWASLSDEEKASRLTKDINVMYTNSTIANLGAGFGNAQASVPLVSRTAPSHFVMSSMTTGAPQESIAESPPAVPAPIVAHRISAPQTVMSVPVQEPSAPPTATGVTAPITQYNEWSANIVVEKYAAKTSFFIHFFLGDFDPDPSKWSFDKNLVGTYSIFTTDIETTGCARCQTGAEEGTLVTGTILLTEALIERLGHDKAANLEPPEVVPYLKKELHWRVETSDDKPIERADIPSLKVTLAHIPVSVPGNVAELPTWGESTNHTDVTTGRPGGASEEDWQAMDG